MNPSYPRVAERAGRTVVTRGPVTGEQEREIAAGYSIKYWRITDKAGKEYVWNKTKRKTVVLYRSNELPGKNVLELLAKDALILYGRN